MKDKEIRRSISAIDFQDKCPDCGHDGLHGKGIMAMFYEAGSWVLDVYCDKCDVEINQIYETVFIKSVIYKENEEER